MMWLKRLFSTNADGITLIEHLQKMLAYHQLMMELYNRAAVSADNDPSKLKTDMRPVMAFKWRLLKHIDSEHEAFKVPDSESQKAAYSACSLAIALMHARRVGQDATVSAIIAGESPRDYRHLDDREFEAVDSLQRHSHVVTKELGIGTSQWVQINCNAYNAVRKELDLKPFGYDEFGRMLYEEVSGKQVDFFPEYNPNDDS